MQINGAGCNVLWWLIPNYMDDTAI